MGSCLAENLLLSTLKLMKLSAVSADLSLCLAEVWYFHNSSNF
jgi:hypothetical protein